MRNIAIIFLLLLVVVASKAQTTALDFNRIDCNGNSHHLYSELDSNNVVIIEFFMLACASCIYAGQDIDAMHTRMELEFPGKVSFYHFGFDDAYSCLDIGNWVQSNGFNSTPFDSGAYQVAYYGGMAMPTIVVVAGSSHEVLFLNNTGFSTSDTGLIANAIRSFYGVPITGVGSESNSFPILELNPNPASEMLKFQLFVNGKTEIGIEIIDFNGKVVDELTTTGYQNGVFNQTLDISSLSNGIYFLKVSSNGTLETYKFTVVNN